MPTFEKQLHFFSDYLIRHRIAFCLRPYAWASFVIKAEKLLNFILLHKGRSIKKREIYEGEKWSCPPTSVWIQEHLEFKTLQGEWKFNFYKVIFHRTLMCSWGGQSTWEVIIWLKYRSFMKQKHILKSKFIWNEIKWITWLDQTIGRRIGTTGTNGRTSWCCFSHLTGWLCGQAHELQAI